MPSCFLPECNDSLLQSLDFKVLRFQLEGAVLSTGNFMRAIGTPSARKSDGPRSLETGAAKVTSQKVPLVLWHDS